MIVNPCFRRAYDAGKLALAAHVLRAGPEPLNPYRPETKRARYWQRGHDRAAELLRELFAD